MKKCKNKAINFILSFILIISLFNINSNIISFASTVDSGTCGDKLFWTLDSNYTLTILGTGAMEDYEHSSSTPYSSYSYCNYPWYKYYNQIKSVVIKNRVTNIGSYAFYWCTELSSITIPDSVTSIGDYAFRCCINLTNVIIPDNVTSIGNSAFGSCGLTNITIPNGVTKINSKAFIGCTGLTSITIPDSVISIDDEAFKYCTGLTSITIPNSVTSIGNSAFENCTELTCITIPNSVISIGDSAFKDCTELTNITIPDSVTSIDSDAFYNTGYYNNISNWEEDALYLNNYLLSCKESKSGDYKIKENTKMIAGTAFYQCSGLTSVTIPDSVISIDDEAFSYCTGLTSITIPNSVTSIGEYAFFNCTGLTSITIPDSVTNIGEYAFYACTGLTDVYYTGTESQWNSINIGSYNTLLKNTNIHYNHIHSFEINSEQKSTCTEDGLIIYKCTACGYQIEEYSSALGHTVVDDLAVEPTCTQSGLTAGSHCSVCGEVLTAQQIVPALGHNSEDIPAVEPTCTEYGKTQGAKCSRCGKTLVNQNSIAPIGHNYSLTSTVNATCTADGYREYTCSNCGLTYQDPILKLCHKNVLVRTTVTCTSDGYDQFQCSVCGTKTSVKATAGHMFEPTINKDGTVTYTCTKCGETEQKTANDLKDMWCDDVINDTSLRNNYLDIVDDGVVNAKDYAILMRMAKNK